MTTKSRLADTLARQPYDASDDKKYDGWEDRFTTYWK